MFDVPVNNFSVMLGQSHCFLGIYQCFGELKVKCLAQGHYTAVVRFEPWTSRSGVRHSTTEPQHPLYVRGIGLGLDSLVSMAIISERGWAKVRPIFALSYQYDYHSLNTNEPHHEKTSFLHICENK